MAVDQRAAGRFQVRYTAQTEWRTLILAAFFLGGVGGGLFLVSSVLNFAFGLVFAWLIITVGKGSTHLIFLGHPLRFWRILVSWKAFQTSWLTRGMWGLAVFLVFGTLSILATTGSLPWAQSSPTGRVIMVIAMAAAAWVMMYTGFVMAQSPAIPLWNTPLLPVLFMFYGLAGGVDLTMISLAVIGNADTMNVRLLEQAAIALPVVIAISIWAYLGLMSSSRSGAREAVRLLTKGPLAGAFWGIVVGIGLVVPLIVAIYAYYVGISMAVTGFVGLLSVAGCLFFRHSILRAGVYDKLI